MIKKVIKKLAKSKNIPTFAVRYNLKGVEYRQSFRKAFFYALSEPKYTAQYPRVMSVMDLLLPLRSVTQRERLSRFFIFNPHNFKQFFFKMRTTEKLCLYGTAYPTNTHGKGEILPPFTKATAFIFLLVLSFMLHTCTAGRVALSHFQNSSL
ncbi:hypothetical protein [Capnocytophaga canis]|uniref:hypothetical protein n=1 Tax=Capnocytophaga canis TaxID=1848903 RepID=UPI00385B9AA6